MNNHFVQNQQQQQQQQTTAAAAATINKHIIMKPCTGAQRGSPKDVFEPQVTYLRSKQAPNVPSQQKTEQIYIKTNTGD
jgi:hypothetical protein